MALLLLDACSPGCCAIGHNSLWQQSSAYRYACPILADHHWIDVVSDASFAESELLWVQTPELSGPGVFDTIVEVKDQHERSKLLITCLEVC